uniref:NOL1/NOP2/Sun domain family member 4 n=1 Tax=Lygus hesperus TaxID=30085 RepID=A0A0A9WF62_LYGHE
MFGRTGLNLSRSPFSGYLIAKRFKNPRTHWSNLKKQKGATHKALEYFDDLYGNVFGRDWPSMRVALLTQSKYVALVNNFSDTERIIPYLENLGAMDMRRILECETERIAENPVKGKKRKKGRDVSESNLDHKLENFKERLKEEEIRNVYPEGAEIIDTTRSSTAYDDASSRLIQPELAGSASALYEFVPTSKLKGKEDWVPESEHFQYFSTDDDCPIIREEQSLLEYPSQLKVFTFVTGCCDPFPRPKRDRLLGVTDYYLMDGASVLPIIALDLRPGDSFLDMCAAPGGKSLLALQTLYPSVVTMNDSSISRSNRLRSVMKEFIINFNEKSAQNLYRITSIDGRNIEDANVYNKILVDVPCTTDRHSVVEDDNNIFKSNRIQERIKIPELQSSLLESALKLVKVGGTVVYSTCSLSPVQNDGVVHMAIKSVHEKTNKRIAIVDMTKALEPTKVMYRYRSNVLKYGHLIVPYLPDNYGPMYFCKFVRLE